MDKCEKCEVKQLCKEVRLQDFSCDDVKLLARLEQEDEK